MHLKMWAIKRGGLVLGSPCISRGLPTYPLLRVNDNDAVDRLDRE